MRAKRAAAGLRVTVSILLGTTAAALFLFGSLAQANTPITSFAVVPSNTQAGGHPDLGVTFAVKNRFLQQSESVCNCEDAKDAAVHLPTGFIGNPHATPQCKLVEFSADSCPIDSQVGMSSVAVSPGIQFNTAVYNLVPPPTRAGLLGFKIFLFDTPQFTVLSGRTGSDYGLDSIATSIYHGSFPLESFQQVLWGVPADPSHDPLRLKVSETFGFPSYLGSLCDENGELSTTDPDTMKEWCPAGLIPTPTASNSPLTPFLQGPGTCDAPLSSSLDVLSYDGETTHADSPWPQMTGCSQLSFNPSLYAQPTTNQTDSASGIDVNLEVPQQQSPSVPSPSELRAAIVTLPKGFSINTNGADGKTSCTDAAANFGTENAAQCPEFARVGSLVIDSSALPGPIPGFVYLGQPLPGNRYRIFLVADGFATHVKLAGTVTPDPATGQLTITFTDLPQSPLTAFNMHFYGSERGLLATPTHCGTYAVTSTFIPWDSSLSAQTSSQFFTLDSGPNGAPCPGSTRPFSPAFRAASAANTAGAHTPFAINLTREDGDQNLAGLSVTTPPGFAGSLKGIPYCPEPAIAQLGSSLYSGLSEITGSACPAASQIGTVTAGAGAGSRPVYVGGKVYLAGPYKGAPLSLVVVVPAVSGPYDLGNVAIRAAIRVDPITAQVTTVADPLPQILEGIPLRARSIRVALDRPDFAHNPTNCEPLAVDATVAGDEGAVSQLSFPYQVAGCAGLPYAPKLTLKLSGGVKRLGHPAIHAVLEAKPGEANTRRASVTLPKGELLDNAHIETICTRVNFAQGTCPAGSLIGQAEVTTPLLDQPLRGSVYLRSSEHELPDIALDLKGQFNIEAVGQIDSVNGRLRTRFETVPDAPISRIVLDLTGGSKGLLVNSESLCDAPKKAMVRMTGQNGVTTEGKTSLQTSCGSKASHGRHHKGRRGPRTTVR
jgi:hypothetical protein